MTIAILDSTFFVHVLRKDPTAIAWLNGLTSDRFPSITPFTWMEIMVGVTNKQNQQQAYGTLSGFSMVYPTSDDMVWVMRQMLNFRLSQAVGTMDCFIASVSYGLQVPIYTHNVKDYLKILPAALVIQPY